MDNYEKTATLNICYIWYLHILNQYQVGYMLNFHPKALHKSLKNILALQIYYIRTGVLQKRSASYTSEGIDHPSVTNFQFNVLEVLDQLDNHVCQVFTSVSNWFPNFSPTSVHSFENSQSWSLRFLSWEFQGSIIFRAGVCFVWKSGNSTLKLYCAVSHSIIFLKSV